MDDIFPVFTWYETTYLTKYQFFLTVVLLTKNNQLTENLLGQRSFYLFFFTKKFFSAFALFLINDFNRTFSKIKFKQLV